MADQSQAAGAVFLSYASQDVDAAARICDALQAAGIEVWFDRGELRGGDAWDSQIKKQIHDCALFAPVISAHTNARSEGYFRREWKQATRRLQDMADDVAFLLPVVIDETREADSRVPEEFFSAHWTRLPGGETPPAFTQRVRQLLGLDPAPASTAKATATIEPSARNPNSPKSRNAPRVWSIGLPLVALLLVLGGGAVWYIEGTSDAPASKSAAVEPVSTADPSAAADARPSIAVLPFENRSREADDAYFVDGVHDDILTQLSRISALKVISRASVEQFRNSKLPMKEIAARLGVTSILEGGVQRAGDRVRITVQLIDAKADAHLWAEKYDRKLTTPNIFAIQSDVAAAIADALQAKLTPSERATVNAMPTQNLAAWEAYQLGRQGVSRRTSATIADAVKYFETAIELDPAFALAYVALADTLTIRTDYVGADRAERRATADRAEKLVSRALQLNPALPEAAVTSAMIAWTRLDYPLAESEFRRAVELNPNSADANHFFGGLLRELNRPEEALLYARRAAQLDPRTPIVTLHVGHTLELLDKMDEAEAEYRRATEIDPLQAAPNVWYANALRLWGRSQEALVYSRRAAQLDPRLPIVAIDLGATLETLGRFDEAAAQYRKAINLEPSESNPYRMMGMLEYGLGHIDKGVRWVERASELEPALWHNYVLLWHMYLDLGLDAQAKRWMDEAMRVADEKGPGHYMTSIQALLAGRSMLAEEHAKAMLAKEPKNPMMLAVLRDVLLRKGDFTKALEHYARPFPKLSAAARGVDQGRFWFDNDLGAVATMETAVDMAVVLKMRDDDDGAARLLALSESVIRGMPRLGNNGFGIADVRIHALRGERSTAVARLREAANAGWRLFWRYARDIDPALASIRNEPEFKTIFSNIERDMARQRAALAAHPKNAPLVVSTAETRQAGT